MLSPKPATPSTTAPTPEQARLNDLAAQRDRLTERFAVLQSELGGTFYEMAIRDHVRMEVLLRKAAELQQVDSALAAVELQIRDDG